MWFSQKQESCDGMRRTERCDTVYRPRELSALRKVSARDPGPHEERLSVQRLHLENSTGLLSELNRFLQF